MRKDDGAVGLRVAAVINSGPNDDDGAGRWVLDVALSSRDSETVPSSDVVALITVAAVEVVSTVGDGEGARRRAVVTGWSPSFPFSSAEGSNSGADAPLLETGTLERGSGSG